MADVVRVITTDYLRRARNGLIGAAITVTAGPVCLAWYLGLLTASREPLWSDNGPMQMTAVIILLLCYAAATVPPLLNRRQGLFVLPLSNWAIATYQLVLGCVVMLGCYLVTMVVHALVFGLRWPYVAPSLFFCVTASCLTLAAWRMAPVFDLERSSRTWQGAMYVEVLASLFRQGVLLCPVFALWCFWFWLHIDQMGVVGWVFWPALDITMTLVIVGVCWGLLVREVGRQRQGETREKSAWFNKFEAWSRQRKVDVPSGRPQAAVEWLLWNSAWPFAVVAATVFTCLEFVPGIGVLFFNPREFFNAMGLFTFVPTVTAVVLGIAVDHQIIGGASSRLRTFVATSCVSDSDLGYSVFRSVLRTYAVFWGLLIVWPVLLVAAATLIYLIDMAASDSSQLFALAPEPPVMIAGVITSWASGWMMAGGVVGLGKKRFGILVCGGFLALACSSLVVNYAALHRLTGLHALAEGLQRFLAWSVAALPFVLTVYFFVQATRRRLVPMRKLLWQGMVVSIAATGCWILLIRSHVDLTWGQLGRSCLVVAGLSWATFLPRVSIPVRMQERRRQ